MSRSGIVRCLLAAVLFGASAPAASELAGEMPSLTLAGLLYLGAGLAVVPSVVRSPPTALALRRDWRPAMVAVVAGGAVGPALLVAGLARAPAATASILLNLELAATVLLAATVFREHLGRRVLASAALVTAAGVILAWEPGAKLSLGALLIAAGCDHDEKHHEHSHDGAVEGRHTHVHQHRPVMHSHPHVPDLHHRHRHDD